MSLPHRGSFYCAIAWCVAMGGVSLGDPMSTAFTYQGRLKEGGLPVNDACDLLFSLWSAATGDVAVFNPRVGLPSGLIVGQIIVNTNGVVVRVQNVSGGAIDAPSNTADVVVLK